MKGSVKVFTELAGLTLNMVGLGLIFWGIYHLVNKAAASVIVGIVLVFIGQAALSNVQRETR